MNHNKKLIFILLLLFSTQPLLGAIVLREQFPGTPFISRTASQASSTLAVKKLIQSSVKTPESSLVGSDETDNTISFVADPLPNEVDSQADIKLELVGKVLNYPNPFSLSSGFTEIGYRLSKASIIKLELFSLSGNRIYDKTFLPTDEGGMAKYNRVRIDKNELGHDIPPGVYLYVLHQDGKLLGKNRMVVMP